MGNSGHGFSQYDLEEIEKKAKEEIEKSAQRIKRIVFISFCSEDLDEVNLLRGQAKNDHNDLEFTDSSLKEPFDSQNAEYIKQGIRKKIERASVTLVFLTNHSTKSKWVNWEIEESIKKGKGVIGVYNETCPTVLPKAFYEHNFKVIPWNHKELSEAIETAANNR